MAKRLGRPPKIREEKPEGKTTPRTNDLPIEPKPERKSGEPVLALLFPNSTAEQRVRIFREDEREAKYVFHGYFPSGEATEERINELFGGGKWKCQLIGRNDVGQEVLRDSLVLKIPGLYKPPTGDLPGFKPPATGTPPPVMIGTLGGSQALPQDLGAVVSGLVDKLTERKATDWPAIMAIVVPVLGTIITTLLTRKTGPDPILAGQLERVEQQLATMKTQAQNPAANAIGDAVKAIRELIEVRDLIGDGKPSVRKDPEDIMWEAVPKLLEVLGQPKAVSPPAPAPPGGRPPVRPPVETLPLWQQLLLGSRTQLLDAAMRGMDPQLAADVAAQFLPQQMVGVAEEFLRRPDAAAILGQVIPELQQFPAWCEGFISNFRGLILEGAEETDRAEVEEDHGSA